MTSPENPFGTHGQDSSEQEVELAQPKTYEEWVKTAAELEAERDTIGAKLRAEGVIPEHDADFNFLLGRLHTAQQEAIAHSSAQLLRELTGEQES